MCYNAIESVLMYISVNEHHSVSIPEYVSDNQCAKSVYSVIEYRSAIVFNSIRVCYSVLESVNECYSVSECYRVLVST